MTLRAGRADLHQRLTTAAWECLNPTAVHRSRQELCDLLAEARDAVLACPHVEQCTICFTIEKNQEDTP